jgi:molybdopterin synthase sulfur carrier subunit
MVNIAYRGALADLTGCREEALPAARNVGDVVAHVKTAYGKEAAKAAKAMLIAVNGKSILRTGLYKTPLAPGDGVSFLPVCAGG